MIRINLVEYREIQKKIDIQTQLFLGCVLLFVSFFFMIILTQLQGARMKGLSHALQIKQQELNTLKGEVKQVTAFEKKEKKLEGMLTVIKRLKKNQTGTFRVLDEINIQMPAEIWLTSVYEKGNVNNEIFDISGYSFSNIGIATFMKNLEHSAFFEKVELVGAEQSSQKGKKLKKFRITSRIHVSNKD